MYEISTPSKWTKYSGRVLWPDVEEFNETHWNEYTRLVNKQQGDKTTLVFSFEVAAGFTVKYGTFDVQKDGEAVDLKKWLESTDERPITVMQWLQNSFQRYLNLEVLNPKD